MRILSRFSLIAVAASAASLLIAGCGAGVSSTASSAGSLHISGSVFGGQQPVSGASIRLLTVNTTTLGGSVTPIIPIGTTVTSAADGSFSITGAYSCTNATQVYIVAVGGDPGSGTNSASIMGAALGACTSLTPATFISINELSTIAAAYTLAPYEGSSWTNIGAGLGTNYGTVGLPNAFLTAALLTNPTPPIGVTLPTAELNTLANILASCVNSTGASSPGCTQLFSVTGASNTFDAAFYIAKNPGASAVTGLYALSSSSGPFQPTLASAPKDFSVAVKYAGSGAVAFNGPSGVAIDAAGNAIVTQQTGNALVAVSPLNGNITASQNVALLGLNGPRGVAVDTNGYVWVANPGAHNAIKIAPYGTNIAAFPSSLPTTYALSAGANPIAIGSDIYGNGYTFSQADLQIFGMKSNGTVVSTLAYPQFVGNGAFSLSSSQSFLVGSSSGQTCLYGFQSNTTTITFNFPSLTCVPAGSATSISAVNYNTSNASAGYAGVGNSGVTGAPLFGLGSSSTSIYLSTTTPSAPTALAFDYSANGFIADANALFKYSISATALSPTGGFGTLNNPQGVAIDPSGNVWVTNAGDNSLSIFVGLATATPTPIASTLH